MKTYPYLTNTKFLKNIDISTIKEQYVKINVLSFSTEKVLSEITGNITGGSITIDGNSAMRRTANISLITNNKKFNNTDIKQLLTINKKIELQIGFKNTTNQYKDYPILWFPQGVFVIISINISRNTQGTSISLTLHDKMALLNGECGGTFPASIVFHEVEDIDENGNIQITEPTIYQIIQQVVNHFGGEQLGKIIISDVDKRIKKVMKWTGATPLYLYSKYLTDGTVYNHFSTDPTDHGNPPDTDINNEEIKEKITQFSYGEDIGYILTDFTYPGELIGNAGDNIVTILDQIKNTLGNYEYFYDVHGNFRFQEIKNYLNTSYSTFLINNMTIDNYLVDYSNGQAVYSFKDGEIIQSYSNSPQYQQIKNDFLVWGKRTSIDGQQIPIRYHLAIDTKPAIGNFYKVFFFTDPDDGIKKAKKPIEFDTYKDFPKEGNVISYYYAKDTQKIYKWNTEVRDYEETPYTIEKIKATDWRTELYLAGVISQPYGLESNYYYTELNNQWPKLYNMKKEFVQHPISSSTIGNATIGSATVSESNYYKGGFFEQSIKQPNDIDFFLDFIDTAAPISEFSVQNIGRRTASIVDDSINCIFEPDNPDIVIIQSGTLDTEKLRNECIARKQEYSQVKSEIYDMLLTGGALKSAYEEIKKELYQYTNYNEQISLSVLPIYYLEPNTRITVEDEQSGIHGDYIIKSISLPLDINGVMSLTCTRAIERI